MCSKLNGIEGIVTMLTVNMMLRCASLTFSAVLPSFEQATLDMPLPTSAFCCPHLLTSLLLPRSAHCAMCVCVCCGIVGAFQGQCAGSCEGTRDGCGKLRTHQEDVSATSLLWSRLAASGRHTSCKLAGCTYSAAAGAKHLHPARRTAG